MMTASKSWSTISKPMRQNCSKGGDVDHAGGFESMWHRSTLTQTWTEVTGSKCRIGIGTYPVSFHITAIGGMRCRGREFPNRTVFNNILHSRIIDCAVVDFSLPCGVLNVVFKHTVTSEVRSTILPGVELQLDELGRNIICQSLITWSTLHTISGRTGSVFESDPGGACSSSLICPSNLSCTDRLT